MSDDRPLLDLLTVFAPLSLLAVGGGSSILGDTQREVVENHGWLTAADFHEFFAIARVSPGPGMLPTLIGWHVAGWLGALVATLAIVIPSSLLIYGLAHVWHSGPPAKWQKALSRGLAPIAAGLILASVFHLLSNTEGQVFAWSVALVICALAAFTSRGTITLLAGGSLVFVGLHLL
jgi:chromate transporter